MARNDASGRFFVSPTAIETWRRWHPHHSDADALETILTYAETARQQPDTAGGLMRFRAGRPWKGYLLVALPERGKTLPVVVDVAPPFDGWRPPGPHGGRREGSGAKPQGGPNPEYRKRLAPDVYAWIEGQEPDYVERLVRADMDRKRKLLS